MIISRQKFELLLADKETTIKAIAEAAKLSNPTVTKIRRELPMLPRTVGKVARVFGVEVEYLVKAD
ncbi:MAG: hypothetical protein LBO03_02895 [Acidaminococcales bacterium]|jgi:ParB-like chromosome segregation protein Spo0J|nr:hypothetical protein [Acidaminococcales bacterium]